MIQGLARFDIKQSEDTMTRLCGTYSYLAPEIFFGQRYTDKADVFSMGIILWEIAYRVIHGMLFIYISTLIYILSILLLLIILYSSCFHLLLGQYQLPYQEYPNMKIDFQIAIKVAENHLRPTTPAQCPPPLASLIQRCVVADPKLRPTTTQILDELTKMEDDYLGNRNDEDNNNNSNSNSSREMWDAVAAYKDQY